MHYGSPTSNSTTENSANPTEACTSDTSSFVEPCTSDSNDSVFDDVFEDVGDIVGELGSEKLPPKLPDQCVLQKSSALFLLHLKEKHKLTQVAIQEIVESETNFTQQRLSVLKQQVCILMPCSYLYKYSKISCESIKYIKVTPLNIFLQILASYIVSP